MTSYSSQLDSAKAAHYAASLLEVETRGKISYIFYQWENGELNANTVRFKLEAAIREAYRSASAVANALVLEQAGIPGFQTPLVVNTDYLDALVTDVRRNLRVYKKSKGTDKDRRKVIQTIQHSAGTAAQRGYTDAVIAGYKDLHAKIGAEMTKVWVANFLGTLPCEHCQNLHGVKVGIEETFPAPKGSGKVYQNLQGPPRHPRCRCYIVILIEGLDTVDQEIEIDNPVIPYGPMSTDDVKRIPSGVFASVLKVLDKIIGLFKKKGKK